MQQDNARPLEIDQAAEDVVGERSLFPYDATEFPAYRNYAVLMGLPPQAVPAIMLAVQMRRQLKARCEQQWRLLRFPGEATKLIQSRKQPLAPAQVRWSGQFAMANGLPLDCIYAMETRTRFQNGILSGGYRLLAQADPRILKSAQIVDVACGSMETSQTIPGSKTGETIEETVHWVRVTYKVAFWNGEEYIGVGMSDSKDEVAKNKGLAQMPAVAETRAANHAYRAALRMIGPQEEAEEETQAEE